MMEPIRLWRKVTNTAGGFGPWREDEPTHPAYFQDFTAVRCHDFDALVKERDEARAYRTRTAGLHSELERERDAATARADKAEQERDDLARLAYIDHEHRFPDATWKARCDELVPDLRAATARADALAALLKEARDSVERDYFECDTRLTADARKDRLARIDAALEEKK